MFTCPKVKSRHSPVRSDVKLSTLIRPFIPRRSEFSSAQSCPALITLALMYLNRPVITTGGITILLILLSFKNHRNNRAYRHLLSDTNLISHHITLNKIASIKEVSNRFCSVSQTRTYASRKTLFETARVRWLCVDNGVGPAVLQLPTERFNSFVNTHGECDRNH